MSNYSLAKLRRGIVHTLYQDFVSDHRTLDLKYIIDFHLQVVTGSHKSSQEQSQVQIYFTSDRELGNLRVIGLPQNIPSFL